MLDYWSFIDYPEIELGQLQIAIVEDCGAMPLDTDGDKIPDNIDIDDDNDGVRDFDEYCQIAGGYDCLPGGFDPGADEDQDKILNYLDADDPDVNNGCIDDNFDGICDKIAAAYDRDGDNVPDFLDLDSDNDGITDLVEAGHIQPDSDGNGIIDGIPPLFGLNGYFNNIETDDSKTAEATYDRLDTDGDKVPDHDDLDSDNDGIHDVAEVYYSSSDSDNDGRIDDGSGNVPIVSSWGLAPLIDPEKTGQPIPLPPDYDFDLIPDWHDLDSDNDGINDVKEASYTDGDNNGYVGLAIPGVDPDGLATGTLDEPIVNTSNPVDTDNDGVPDWHDLDSDNDGINDVEEGGNTDPDDDGMVNTGIPIVNIKGQPANATSFPFDTDGDLYPDFRDLDTDNDGINDVIEGDNADPDNDGIVGTGMPTINSRGQTGIPTSNPADTDNDYVKDYRDLDTDNDGINDVEEGGNPDPDNDGIINTGVPIVNDKGQATGEGIPTSIPTDTDDDGNPNFRDLDSDSDGVPDVIEGGNPDPDNDSIIGTGIPIVNINGQATSDQDNNPLSILSDPTDTDGDMIPDYQELDSDDDNIPDSDECNSLPCRDWDGDGMPDFQDVDRDNDGIVDSYECENSTPCTDTDNDGIPDVDDLDSDDDGLADMFECPGGAICPDTDNDGIPNFRDVDSDDDGYSDTEECPGGPSCPDLDEDGIIDVLDNLCDKPLDLPLVNINNPICKGDMIRLFVQNSFPPTALEPLGYTADFIWMNGAGDTMAIAGREFEFSSLVPEAIGPFSVQVWVRDCSSPQSDPVEVVPATPSTPDISTDKDILCEGGELILQANEYESDNVSYDWFHNGQIIGSSVIPEFRQIDVNETETGDYSVIVEVDGCPSLESGPVSVKVFENAFLRNSGNTTAGDFPACGGDIVQMHVPFVEGASYEWVGPNDYTADDHLATIYEVTPELAGDYYAAIMIPGCPTILSEPTTVYVYGNSTAILDEYTIQPDEILNGDVRNNDLLANIDDWTVHLTDPPKGGTLELHEDGTFTYRPRQSFRGIDVFKYEICNADCPDYCDETQVIIRVFDAEAHFNCFIPNTITPNGDGKNDVFKIDCLENYPDHQMTIFNRWGDKVYEAEPYLNDWEGTFVSKPLPAGTYFYLLRLRNDADDFLQGFFTIVR